MSRLTLSLILAVVATTGSTRFIVGSKHSDCRSSNNAFLYDQPGGAGGRIPPCQKTSVQTYHQEQSSGHLMAAVKLNRWDAHLVIKCNPRLAQD